MKAMAHKNKSNQSPMKPKNRLHKSGGRHRTSRESFSPQEASDRIGDIFHNHGFSDVSRKDIALFTQFYFLLMKEQELQNFTRLLNLRDIVIKHFIDCLMVPKQVVLKFPLLDLGSGPGFPGIPLKIIFPEGRLILTEGVQKRVEFLKTVREQLNLKNLDIIGRNINHTFLYPVQGVISRAVEDIPNTLKNVFNALQTGGQVYFMKGPNVAPEIAAAQKEWAEYYKLVADHAYSLPHTPHERRLLVYEKIKPSPPVNLNQILEEEENEHPWKD